MPGLGSGDAASHGPKVIPPNGTYETARYGDRPFPVVPAAYRDRAQLPANSGEDLVTAINDPANPGSTFNLFQEMSYGQLFPHGTVPSAGIATADFTDFDDANFHHRELPAPDPDSCFGTYTPELVGDPATSSASSTASTSCRGARSTTARTAARRATRPWTTTARIDDACGTIGKAVYDAAALADPEIDYNDFDTDKDGVVDFFMLVFAGCGGNGPSQRACDGDPYGGTPPANYDNIWPHSSSLLEQFFDPASGVTGYETDDRLTNLEGELLFYVDENRVDFTTTDTGIPAFVRVGPYNVNPEDSIDFASVISHEYGHSLGLPDYYGTTLAQFYGRWNLMATDYSQHMDLNGRQELGWVIPRELPDGDTTFPMVDSTIDIHSIDWRTPAGTPYTLSGPGVHNGDAYTASLPRRILLQEELMGTSTEPEDPGSSPSHVWWSRRGDDFGCVPARTAHSLDIPLELWPTCRRGRR